MSEPYDWADAGLTVYVLKYAGVVLPREVVEGWSQPERAAACQWAETERDAAGSPEAKRLPVPDCVHLALDMLVPGAAARAVRQWDLHIAELKEVRPADTSLVVTAARAVSAVTALRLQLAAARAEIAELKGKLSG